MDTLSRRQFMTGAGASGIAVFLTGCAPKSESKEVTAVEDLMREHGVLRRALFVYSETAVRLRSNPATVPPDTLQKTARLFRAFGEDYHEKQLEEAYIFPAVRMAGGEAARYPEILIQQHARGREITDYILALSQAAEFDPPTATALALAVESFVRMYRPHAAREDTEVFPAWKQALTAKQLDEMNDRFEDIEHRMFGENGFENAVGQISGIEGELGLGDLAQFTAPYPQSK
jgi:hemerythrin-like domain-containing protein